MSDFTFNFEVDGQALHYLSRAMDKYVEKWPGGHPDEQARLHYLKNFLYRIVLEYKFNME